VAQLTAGGKAYKQTHPGMTLPCCITASQTFAPLSGTVFCPLVGIDRLTEFDTREHPLGTLLGGLSSGTLHQFLGQLERVGAARGPDAALVPEQVGPIIYVDGT